jgi:hypothetical protein
MQDMNEAQAQERIEELRGFYWHLAAFIPINLFLFMINMVNMRSGDDIWFIYPLFGWGIGLFAHAVQVFFGGKDWEARKMQELTGLAHTREELHQLTERTDTLVKILSSVDWEKIDPELLETKQSLENARQRIDQLKLESNSNSQEKVTRDIEKLEEFVTSSKFGYYELAAQDQK